MTCSILTRIWYHFLAPNPNLGVRYGQNSYVLITGGSLGLGKELAKCFAKRGFNLILLARGRDNLEVAKKEI
jgi:hypothetical protein